MHPDDPKFGAAYPADRRKPILRVAELIAIDFPALLRFLQSRGYNAGSIAMYANISRTSVRNYIDGNTTPLHPHGERLIKLWCEITGNPRDAAPTKREGMTLSVSRS